MALMSRRRVQSQLALGLAFLAITGAWASGTSLASDVPSTVQTNRGCYLIGQTVTISGAGFAANRSYDVAIDGVDFGQGTTGPAGRFVTSLVAGGLSAGVIQSVDQLDATDGTSSADTTFTVTRRAGARILASSGDPHTLRAPFAVWGFALDGAVHPVYLHYVSPSGRLRTTVRLGRTGGQCGYLLTPRRREFPFNPSPGTWTLQVDTVHRYSTHPAGPRAAIHVVIHKR